MSAGKVILVVVGALVVLVGLCVLIGGGVIVGTERNLTDRAGFLTTRPVRLEQDAYAVIAPVKVEGEWPWWWTSPVTVRVEAEAGDLEKSVFVGLGPRRDVQEYLAGAAYDEVAGLELPHGPRLTYLSHPGTSAPQSPTSETFWQAAVQGPGKQTLTWELEPGDWLVVLMNTDASRGLDLSGSVGARAPWLLGVGIGLLTGGAVLVAVGVLTIALVARRARAGVGGQGLEPSPAPGTASAYPLTFKGERTEPLSPGLWLVKWFLLIPHYVVLAFLWLGFAVSWLLSLVAILFTGRYPRGLFDFNVGVLRWTWRVGFYGYSALATDQYPPFTLRAGGHPADLDVPYPETLGRGLVLVKWWLLALPHYAVVACFQGGGGPHGGGLALLLSLFAAVAHLFTGRYPKDLFDLVLGMNRWSYRVAVYAALMTDRYPPFRLDE